LLNDPGDKIIQPGIKNPGLAIGISANYKLHRGWYLLGNLKDLGFIKWKKDPYTYRFDESLHFDKNTTNKQDNSFDNKISNDLLDAAETKSFITPINGKAELLITKNLRNYQPTLLLTKNLINRGGIIALTNALQHRAFNFSLTNAYNLDKYFMHGGQFMIKSPNTEFYLGSDHLFKSYYVAKGLKTENEHIGKGNTAASVYLGFSLKFGRVQQRWQNASIIPMDDKKVGFFKRVFLKIFKKKKKPGGQDERE
ncbi:MAG: hypothetical protein H7Y07_06695, partial [Pyrinomonadaceae bacterium]|nr:hypothetical protein [Sphingobacteriaceae bacterium]